MGDGWYREKVETLYTPEQIQARIRELGALITRDYRDRPLVLLCVLKGSFVFAADLARPVDGEDVLIVEDIVDTGLTLDYLMHQVQARNAASVKICALLHKPARTKKKVSIDYLGFTIDDVFVVGYGLDWAQKYRNMPEIGVVISPGGG